MQLQRVVLLITPFVLIALFHHVHYTTNAVPQTLATRAKALPKGLGMLRRGRLAAESGGNVAAKYAGAGSAGRAESALARGPRATGSDAAAGTPATAAGAAPTIAVGAHGLAERPGMFVYNRLLQSTPVGAGSSGPSKFDATWRESYDDHAARYPPPTLSPKRLLDGSPNFLPTPDAESDDPSDLRWRKAIVAGQPCPKGRRPFHIILTAQSSACLSCPSCCHKRSN